MKKYLYSGALALVAVFTLSACAKPKLDAKLSVNDIVYMSGSDLKLKDDQTLVEVSFKLENTSEDMENELKTSAKQFYLKDEDGKKVTASKIDKDDLPTLFNKNKNVEDATDDFRKVEADDDAYAANHPNLTDDLKNYLQSNGANAGNVDQLTRQYYMETYLPNSIKEVSPSAPKTEGTNIFSDYSVELTKKDDKWAFPDKDSYVGKWNYYPLFYAYTGQQGTITKNR